MHISHAHRLYSNQGDPVLRVQSIFFSIQITCYLYTCGYFCYVKASKRSILNFVFSVLSLRLLGYISSLDIIIIIIFSTVAGDRPLTNQAWAYKITLFKPHVVSLVVGLFVLDITTCMWYSRVHIWVQNTKGYKNIEKRTVSYKDRKFITMSSVG